MKDLHSTVRTMVGIAPVAIGTTGSGKTGKIIDTLGYGGVEYVNAFGTITATNATVVAAMLEGDVTGTLTTVAAANISGTLAAAGVAAAATRTSAVSKNVTKRVGYLGGKRYVQLNLSSTVTAGTIISSVAVLHTPNVASTPNP